jgi:hypothetical protein
MLRVPVDLQCEFRGREQPRQFNDKDTGDLVEVPARLKFEVETPDGDVQLLILSQNQLIKVLPSDVLAGLSRGDRVRVLGLCVLQDRGSEKDSYFQVTAAFLSELDGKAASAGPKATPAV